MTCDAAGWDMQNGVERMMTALLPALAGADNLSGIGGAWENAASLEMLIIDDEIYSDVFRIVRGIDVDEDRLAADIIDKVGPMGTFLAQRHTMKYLREGEVRQPAIWDKRTRDKARAEGIRPIQDVAREKARRILREHIPTPLDRDVDQDLARVVAEGSRRLLAAA
jgi:trimethylamine--corrinoid protein Co-methyltransferase